MKFFIDQCIPDSVGRSLINAGHEVIFLRQYMAVNSPDPLVAAASEMEGAILVTADADFKAIAPRAGKGNGRRFKRLSRIGLQCQGPQAAGRVEAALSLIEHEWAWATKYGDGRMIVEIKQTAIRTLR